MAQWYPKSWTGTPKEWEELCFRCGKCCHCNIAFKKATVSYINERARCRHLKQDNTCAVYFERFKNHVTCVPITEAVREEVIPGGCAYEPYANRTKAHFDAHSPEELEAFLLEQPDFPLRRLVKMFGLKGLGMLYPEFAHKFTSDT